MHIRFTNTMGGALTDFEPLDPPRVTVYVCGPTVYDVPHVGHARAAVVFDTLNRHLRWRGYDVFFVRNITDVDDKIIARANELDTDAAVVAERYTRVYEDAMRELNILPPDVAPRATGHILEMQELIARLIDRSYAYVAEGSVFYATEKFPGYGKLSGRTFDDEETQSRVDLAPGQASIADFALWKAAKPGEPSWPSPWGRGRPGWHIECSAMAERYLGMPFDIHGGGADLIFPHHENEIAQSEAAAGTEPFARFWLHNGHVQIQGEKMSKSLKNYVLVEEVLADYGPQVLRLFFSAAHYRSQIAYSPEGLDEARAVWDRFRAFLRAAPDRDVGGTQDKLAGFGAAMDDDLNTPLALSELHGLVTEGNKALEAGDTDGAAAARAAVVRGLSVLGVEPEDGAPGSDLVAPLVEWLLAEREQARADKDFDRADVIRDRLHGLGVRVEDSPQGPRWHLG